MSSRVQNIIWCCKRQRDLVPYPVDRSADIEQWYQSKDTKKYKLNRDYRIIGKIDARKTVVFFEENRNTQEQRVVYRVIQWAFHQPSAGPDSPKWELFSLKECLQIEDALEKGQNRFSLWNRGVIHFNSLPERPIHFEFYSLGSNLRGLIRRGGSTDDDESVLLAMSEHSQHPVITRELQQEADQISRIKGPPVVPPAIPPVFRAKILSTIPPSVPSVVSPMVPPVIPAVVAKPNPLKVDEIPFDENPYDTLSAHRREQSVVNQVKKRVAPNVPKLPKPLQSEWRESQKKKDSAKSQKRDSHKRISHFRYKLQNRRDSDIESEFQGKYEEIMGNRLQVHHERRSKAMNANLNRLAAERKLDQHRQQLLRSVPNYEMLTQRIYEKAEEDLYERQKYLKSINYKMQGRGGRQGQRSVDQMAKSNQMMLRRLERERVDLEMTNKMNEVERELIMIDSGLAEEKSVDSIMLTAKKEAKKRQSARKRRQSKRESERAQAQSKQKPFFEFL